MSGRRVFVLLLRLAAVLLFATYGIASVAWLIVSLFDRSGLDAIMFVPTGTVLVTALVLWLGAEWLADRFRWSAEDAAVAFEDGPVPPVDWGRVAFRAVALLVYVEAIPSLARWIEGMLTHGGVGIRGTLEPALLIGFGTWVLLGLGRARRARS